MAQKSIALSITGKDKLMTADLNKERYGELRFNLLGQVNE
jgi:hypothetical protein